ncbi:olfactory receptor 1019 [Xenopus laevis]|uniref:Olfactory receptor n=2 Tax=Xenopus laevis TaxID=8355 RepID=A0A974C142_XENLA|nr:olfactory receptor 1019 [Xenopus laevis]OCT64615.1 hypothetical protein XELAEV_18045714mg [Xenopus laevis]
MENQTTVSELTLLGLSYLPKLEHQVFVMFLLAYLATLSGNLLIMVLILTDKHLHTPMYFLLGNLACVDVCYSQVTGPRMLLDFYSTKKIISYQSCLTQAFFFMCFARCECYLLVVMSYDRYVAVCHPLHYIQTMSWNRCTHLIILILALGSSYSLVEILFTLRLTFCGPSTIHNFFCDLPQLLTLSCTDTFPNMLLLFVLGGIISFSAFFATFLPYVYIFYTVHRIQTKNIKLKALSTCTSHLTVVCIFYGTLCFAYLHPHSRYFDADIVVAVVYAAILPLLNPIIYSLRNGEIRSALGRMKKKCFLKTSK